MIRESRLLSMR